MRVSEQAEKYLRAWAKADDSSMCERHQGIAMACRELLEMMPEAPLPPNDAVEHPKHYTSHPSGINCIQVTEHMGFNLGNAIKYVWRADLKHDAIEDLRKAKWYIERELQKRGVGHD